MNDVNEEMWGEGTCSKCGVTHKFPYCSECGRQEMDWFQAFETPCFKHRLCAHCYSQRRRKGHE